MIKNFNTFKKDIGYNIIINEKISLKPDYKRYYPYSRILIIIRTQNEYEKIISYIEDLIDKKINITNLFDGRKIECVSLKIFRVFSFLNEEELLYDDEDVIDDYELFGRISLYKDYTTKEELLEYLDILLTPTFYKRGDVLDISNIQAIKSLLLSGKKILKYDSIYKNDNKNVYESLLDHLKGPVEKEVWDGLFKKYNDDYQGILFASAKSDFLDGVKKSLDNICKNDDFTIQNITRQDYANLLLNDVITYNSLDVLKYLIEEENASVDGYYGFNLENAASNNHTEIIEYLLHKGANIDINNSGPLYRAITNNNIETVEILLKNGAKIPQYIINIVIKENDSELLKLVNKYIIDENN